MSQENLNLFLETQLGLSPDAIGLEVMSRAIDAHKSECGCEGHGDYLRQLKDSRKQQEKLIADVVVPETWFFRNRKSFDFLIEHVKTEWQTEHKKGPLRILSIPCSSGEEPYSIAMALIDSGFPENRLRIDAVDINAELIEKAKRAVYHESSFRVDDLSFRERYFEKESGEYRLSERIKQTVHFMRGNILSEPFVGNASAYDVIFCRNLLIYMSPSGRKKTFDVISRLLKKNGVVFLGHAERQIAPEHGFIFIHRPGVFACRRDRWSVNRSPHAPSKNRHRPRQRLFEKAAKALRSFPPPPSQPSMGSHDPIIPAEEAARTVNDEAHFFDRVQRLADEGALPSACRLCQDFLNKHPAHIQANFLMGLIYEALDEAHHAEEFFNKTIYLDPCHPHALAHLAFIVEAQGDEEKAMHLRKRAQRLHSGENYGLRQ
ncbi:MAG: CheR family methyltransferase [Deltaproteobacteria bacterium]|nr:CheR family methyltransferase [Deltaproteobacteria bacterium]